MSGPFSLLAIFAHPDDESFTVGGTLARYAAEGGVASLLCATRGEAGIEGVGPEEAARVREQELRAACAVLGVSEVRFLSYRDGELAQADPAEVTARMAQAMQELCPQVVITFGPDGISGHPDHVAVSRQATAAFDAVAGEGFVRRLYYVAPSPATEQGCGVPAGEVGTGVVGADIPLGSFGFRVSCFGLTPRPERGSFARYFIQEERMVYKELRRQIEELQPRLTPAFVEEAVSALLRQGEDVGGGINAIRLVKHLLGSPQLNDVEVTWAYDRLKPSLRAAFEQIPSLYFFEGD